MRYRFKQVGGAKFLREEQRIFFSDVIEVRNVASFVEKHSRIAISRKGRVGVGNNLVTYTLNTLISLF